MADPIVDQMTRLKLKLLEKVRDSSIHNGLSLIIQPPTVFLNSPQSISAVYYSLINNCAKHFAHHYRAAQK